MHAANEQGENIIEICIFSQMTIEIPLFRPNRHLFVII